MSDLDDAFAAAVKSTLGDSKLAPVKDAATAPAAAPAVDADPYSAVFKDATRSVLGGKGLVDASGASADEPAGPERSLTQELGRQAGLTVRGAINGALTLPVMGANVLGGVANDALAVVDKVRGAKEPGFRFPDQGVAVDQALTAAGLPAPESGNERIVQDALSAMTGGGAFAKAGQALSKFGGTVTKAVGDRLGANIGTQIVASGTGAAAAGKVREEGGTAGEQVAANIAGTFLPGVTAAGASGATRLALRGGEAGRANLEKNIGTFKDAAGITPTLGQGTEGRVARGVESVLSKTPGGAGVIAAKAQDQATKMGASVDALTKQLAPEGANAVSAGEAIVRGVKSFKDGFLKQQKDLYGRLDKYIPSGERIKVDRTREALASLNDEIAGAPALSQEFKNAHIARIEQALANDTQGVDAVLTRPGMREYVDNMRANLQQQADRAAAENASRARLLAGGAPEPVMTPQQIDDQVRGYLASQVDDRLPYESLKKLRTLVGREISNNSLVADVPRDKWRGLYSALSEDLGDAAKGAGKEAYLRWEVANRAHKIGIEKLDQLDKVLGNATTTPERIFSNATNGMLDGNTTIGRVMDAIPETDRRAVAAAVLQKMGRAVAGQQDAEGTAFSANTFLTNLSKIGPQARETLFDRTGVDGVRDRVKLLAEVAANSREGGKVFANPSGTSGGLAQLGATLSAASAAVPAWNGNFMPLAAVATPIIGANLGARAATSERLVNWAAKPTTVNPGTVPAGVSIFQRAQTREDRQNQGMDQLSKASTVDEAINGAMAAIGR